MIKAVVRTALLVGTVLLLSQFVPFVAAHEQALLIAAIAIGLIGIITRVILILFFSRCTLRVFPPFLLTDDIR